MNTSDVIVAYLEAAGVRHVFGYPGDPSVELLEAARRAGMKFVLATREGTAGLMAEAYGQLTGLPGVCLSTLGPGSTNLVNAVASALLDRVPMIAISGQIESRRERTFTHQVVDHGLLFTPVSKWAAPVLPTTVGSIMRKALRIAMAERPGPVHLTTPADVVAAVASDAQVVLPPLRAVQSPRVFAAPGVHADPMRRIEGARRPIVLAGMAAVRGGAGPALRRFAEALECPVVVAPMAKGVLPETHPLFAGTLDMACNAFVWDFLRGADLLVTAGFDAVELIKPWSLQVPTICIDSVPNTDQVFTADTEIVGDIADIVDALAREVRSGSAWTRGEIAAHRARLRELYAAGRVPGRLNPGDVVDLVRAAMPVETLVTVDIGSHKLLVGQGWATHEPGTLLTSNGLSSMGFSLPAAIAAKLVHPQRPVVCFTGDGGLAMVQGELRVAASLGLSLVVVVFCDDSLNRIELKQSARHYPSWGTRFDPTDIAMLAQAMGCDGVNVASTRELEGVLAAPRAAGRPLVIGARIDPSQYAAQF